MEDELEKFKQSPALQTLIIGYDPISDRVGLIKNEFRTFEALGVIEAIKATIIRDWLED